MFTTTAYNTLGEATEMCLDLSMLYGYAETTDLWGRHYGDYGDRPAALGQRAY